MLVHVQSLIYNLCVMQGNETYKIAHYVLNSMYKMWVRVLVP